jgi:hypothetical protein
MAWRTFTAWPTNWASRDVGFIEGTALIMIFQNVELLK